MILNQEMRRPWTTAGAFHIQRASDSYVWDAQGARYLDSTSGWNVVNAGWNNEATAKDWLKCINKLTFRPSWCAEEKIVALQEAFEDLAPGYFLIASCTGGEAID